MSEEPARQSKNQLNGAQAMVQMLKAYGVEHIFGLCGDTSLPFYDALSCLDHGMSHYLLRDERHAGYMADGYARISGRPGICEAPSGGGASYILPALVEANESSIPILAITSDIATQSRGRYALTELDQTSLFRPVTKWCDALDSPNRLPAQIRKAFRVMTTGRCGAVQLTFPFDVQKAPCLAEDVWAQTEYGQFPAAPSRPDPQAVGAIVDLLLHARRAIVICGGGVVIARAEKELSQLAKLANLAIVTTISGQGAISETDPHAGGVIGANGGVAASRALVQEADLVLFIGCRAGSVTTERWQTPCADQTIIHIDCDPEVIGANYKTEIGLACDARLAICDLCAEIKRRLAQGQEMDHGARARVEKLWREKLAAFQPLAESHDTPLRPEYVIAELSRILPQDAIIAADPGTPCPYFSAYYRWRQAGRHFITNRAHGALGYALAAAMGAHIARPQAKIIAAMGDGSFGFCCGEYETITRYQMPIISLVFSNASYGWIKAGQKTGFGARYHNVDFTRSDHAAIAAAFGVKSWSVREARQLEPALRSALACKGPTLIDIISQPLHLAKAPVSEWIA